MSYTVANWHPFSEGPSGPTFNPPAGLKPLKRRYVHELLHGELDDPERFHEAFLPPAMAAFAAGWPDTFVERLLMDSPVLGPIARMRGTSRLQNVLAKAKASAHRARVNDYVSQLRIDLAEARSIALSIQWPKIEGVRVHNASMTKVLIAILDVADLAATTRDIHLATRRIGLASGTDKSVASRAIRKLVRLGILHPSEASKSARRGDANGYDLKLPALGALAADGEHPFDHRVWKHLSHDAFRRGVLGPSAFRVLACLSDQTPMDVSDVAGAVGLSRGWVKQLLDKMALYRLAIRRDGRWLRVPESAIPAALDEAARHSRHFRRGERMHNTYESERQHFRYQTLRPGVQVDRGTGEIRKIA